MNVPRGDQSHSCGKTVRNFLIGCSMNNFIINKKK